MRVLIIVLAILNVGFFSWQYLANNADIESEPYLTHDVTKEIQLLSETRSLLPKVEPDTSMRKEGDVLSGLTNRNIDITSQCLQLGPFDSKLSQRWAETILKINGLRSFKASGQKAQPTTYWVVIKPYNSRVEAFQTLQSLHENNIESFLITEGEHVNGIGLDNYEDRTLAEKLQVKMDYLGFETEIVEHSKPLKTFWIETKYDSKLAQSEPLWVHLSQSFPGLERSLINCENVTNNVALQEKFE